jgi:hypothetical protein
MGKQSYNQKTLKMAKIESTMTRKRGFGARSSLPALFQKASVTNRLGSRKEGGMPTDRLSAEKSRHEARTSNSASR